MGAFDFAGVPPAGEVWRAGCLQAGHAGDFAQGLFQVPCVLPLLWARLPDRPGLVGYGTGAAACCVAQEVEAGHVSAVGGGSLHLRERSHARCGPTFSGTRAHDEGVPVEGGGAEPP